MDRERISPEREGQDPTLQGPPERTSTLDRAGQGFEEAGALGGLGGLAKGLGEMLVPRAGLPGQRGLSDILTDFVEFSPLGDVGDVTAALDPSSGLDPLERLIAASPLLGVGAVGARQAYKRYGQRHQNSLGQQGAAASMLPPPDQSFDLESGFEELGGVEATPEQARQQAAHFEQLAFESQSPFSQSVLRAETWEDLGASLVPEGVTQDFNTTRMADKARMVGAAVVSIVPDPKLYGPDQATAEFVAAKMAIAKWNKAADLGIIDTPYDVSNRTFNRFVGRHEVETILEMAQLEAATSGVVGPDLAMPTPGRLGRVWRDERTGETQVAYGIVDEVLPTERVFDEQVMMPVDPGAVRRRQQAIDFDAASGLGASNIARAYLEAPPEAIADPQGWYRNFNRSARALSEATGYSVHQVAGVIGALSANQPWLPNNLIGGVHVVLQTAGLEPGTAQYNAAFREATIGSGWAFDMFDEAGVETQQQFEQQPGAPGGIPDFEGLTEQYADPENAPPVLDETKQEKVEMILKGNIPAWMATRALKTNTFARLGAEPSLVDLVVTDTWSDRVFWGTFFTGTPLAFDGRTKKVQLDPNETYHDPVTGESVRGDDMLERVNSMAEEHGWTKEQVDRWKGLLTVFPSKTAQARFFAQARAHLLVRDEFELDTGHAVQSTSWTGARAWKGISRRIENAKTKEELAEIAREAHLDTAFFTHLEGNPQMERTAAGMVWEVDDTLSGALPTEADLKAAAKGMQRPSSSRVTSSIIAVRGPDGRVTPYANPETVGVEETLRHATPSGIKVGPYERYISKRPRQVLSVQDHFSDVFEYRREDGRKAAGHATLYHDPEGPGHPGTLPGDRVVVYVPKDSASAVESVLNNSYPFDYSTGDARASVTAASRNQLAPSTIEDLTDAQLGEVLQNNDWFAISAYRAENSTGQNWDAARRLKLDIQKAGGEVIDAEGRYPMDDGTIVDEPSFLVTGLTYADAVRLGEKYGQEAVAARYGMLNMDGTYHPVQEKVRFGESVDANSHTRLSTGQKFSFDYEWGETLPLPEDVDTLADVAASSEPVARVTVEMGGDYGGPGWNATDQVLSKLTEIPGARVRLYTHSVNKVPAGYVKATESVVTDQAGVTGSVLHRSGDRYARHHADVWIPEWENNTLSENGFEGERSRRGTLDARSVMEVDQEAGMVWFDKDLAIRVDPEADVTMAESGPVFRSLKVDGQLVRELQIDTTGPVPILVVGEGGVPAPGRTTVELSRGTVSKITPHSKTDWADARDALSGAGLIPDGESVIVEYPAEGPEGTPQTAEISYSPDALVSAKDTVATLEADMATTRALQEKVPSLKKVRLGRAANPDLHRQVTETIEGLHGHRPKFPGVDVVGPLPEIVWEGKFGIDTMFVTDKPELDMTTLMGEDGGIIVNERKMHTRWNRGASGPTAADQYGYLVRNDRYTDFEATLVHEMGHMLEDKMPLSDQSLASMVTRTMDDLGGTPGVRQHLSRYALTQNREFFSEAYLKVMIEGRNAHPALVRLVKDVMMLVNQQ